ncbi:MAG TPA: hypothetical protein DCG48_03960 [Rhodospirillaceae bacterium]|nr:hypothetical protein [Rhodospirillaceae bacterium]
MDGGNFSTAGASAPVTPSDGGVALRLSESWEIHFDPCQWMICKARNLRSQRKWQPLAYIGGRKASLLRVLAEMDAEITPEAMAILNAWPKRFRDWRAALLSREPA